MAAEMPKLQRQLEETPTDPGANKRVGLYECLVKEDWKAGLLRLLLSDDADLRRLAAADLSRPSRPEEQARLADDWWAYAEKLEGQMQASARWRAADWYRKAFGKLTGLPRTTAMRRIEQIESDIPNRQRILFASDAVLDRFLLARRFNRNGVWSWQPVEVSEHWQVADDQLVVTSTERQEEVLSIVGSYYRSIEYVRVLGRIVPPQIENLRVTAGPLHVIFNWELGAENHAKVSNARAGMTQPHRLVPGMTHVIEIKQAGKNALVLVDGKEEFSVPVQLQGIVQVGTAVGSIAAYREIVIEGEIDFSREPTVDGFPDRNRPTGAAPMHA
jgi:hypothetical protein